MIDKIHVFYRENFVVFVPDVNVEGRDSIGETSIKNRWEKIEVASIWLAVNVIMVFLRNLGWENVKKRVNLIQKVVIIIYILKDLVSVFLQVFDIIVLARLDHYSVNCIEVKIRVENCEVVVDFFHFKVEI